MNLAALLAFDPVFDALPQPSFYDKPSPPAVNDNGIWRRLDNEQRLASIKELDAAGKTPTEVAEELGTTPEAVRSMAYRANYRLQAIGRVVVGERQWTLDDRPIRADAWDTPTEPVGFMENTGCMWPVSKDGVDGFCGCGTTHGSYCERHFAMSRGR